MRVRVWWIGVAAICVIAFVAFRWVRRGGDPQAEPKLEAGDRDRLQDGRGVRSDRFDRAHPNGAGVAWPRAGAQSARISEAPPSTLDASVLAAELAQQVEAIRASGPASAVLTHDAEVVSRPWEAMARASGKEIEVKSWECHLLGCFATAVHHSRESVDELTSKILASAELASWSGTKTQSAPIPGPNGTFEVTWLLYVSPDAGSAP